MGSFILLLIYFLFKREAEGLLYHAIGGRVCVCHLFQHINYPIFNKFRIDVTHILDHPYKVLFNSFRAVTRECMNEHIRCDINFGTWNDLWQYVFKNMYVTIKVVLF